MTNDWQVETDEDGPVYTHRIDLVFEGAVESTDYFESLEEATDQYDFMISEWAGNEPGKNWRIDLYDERPYPPEVIDSHVHEAEDLYEVTFSVRVNAEDEVNAEVNARDYLEQFIGMEEPSSIEIVEVNRDELLSRVEHIVSRYAAAENEGERANARVHALNIYKDCKEVGRTDLRDRLAVGVFEIPLEVMHRDTPEEEAPATEHEHFCVQIVEGGIPQSPEVFHTEAEAVAHWREAVAELTAERPEMWEVNDPSVDPDNYQYIAFTDEYELRIL